MKITYSPITFSALKMYKRNGINFPKDFQCRVHDDERSSYYMELNNDTSAEEYIMSLRNDNLFYPMANEAFTINSKDNFIFIDSMITEEDKQSIGLGTCMHLAGIIEMMENDIDKICLYSTASAMPFHIKNGFKPTTFLNGDILFECIRTIANDKTPQLKNYSEKAKMLLNTYLDYEIKQKIFSKLLVAYMQEAFQYKTKKELKELMPSGTYMELHRQDVIDNKEHYNTMFRKYNIDYEIQ